MPASHRYLPPPRTHIRRWVRLTLVLLVLGWAAVFAVAGCLDPYDESGKARRMETHRQLGLPECTFKMITGLPCPSCGMTTSFALLVRGELRYSLRANFAGTALALFGILFIPWGLACAWAGRILWVRSVESTLFWVCITFLVLLLLHWAVALLLARYG